MSLFLVPGFRMWMALLCLWGLYVSVDAQDKIRAQMPEQHWTDLSLHFTCAPCRSVSLGKLAFSALLGRAR